MAQNGVAGVQARPTMEVTISTGVFSAENSQRFALQAGGSLRIGHETGSHVKLDLNGVSGTHAELLFQKIGSEEAQLCVCDHSKNGTAVRPGPHVPGSSWASKIPPPWERLVVGVPRPLASGWQLLAPARSRKGDQQMPFHKRMLTVYTKAPTGSGTSAAASVEESAAASTTLASKEAATPEDSAKLHKEKKRKRKDDPARDRKRARGKEGDEVPAVAPAAVAPAAAGSGLDRRVAQQGAVEEELARREFARQGAVQENINQEVARTARPKRKGQPAQTQRADVADEESDGTIVPEDGDVALRSPSPARAAGELAPEAPGMPPRLPRLEATPPAQEVRDDDDDQAEAATRAVAAAAALRAMKAKQATAPKKLKDFAASPQAKDPATIEEIDSEAEGPAPKQTAPLTTANVAKLGGSASAIDFDLRSVSPISAPGVKPKKKEKKRTGKIGGDRSPSRRKSGQASAKTRLVARSKDSPDRWAPSETPPRPAVKAKKRRSAGSQSPTRNRSREKRRVRR